jgi:hypothetical protein
MQIALIFCEFNEFLSFKSDFVKHLNDFSLKIKLVLKIKFSIMREMNAMIEKIVKRVSDRYESSSLDPDRKHLRLSKASSRKN